MLSVSLMDPGVWHLHSLNGVSGVISLLYEISVLHVLCESLQEAEWLIEDDRHGDLRQFLKRQRQCPVLIKLCYYYKLITTLTDLKSLHLLI